ncbi:hypothetical protein B0H14DRAFT_3702013 [Mycena olivaceomarginata]|nr:hypothetical protein B0H14DRAFT_3702013 [Mycena olivaceomarginata]
MSSTASNSWQIGDVLTTPFSTQTLSLSVWFFDTSFPSLLSPNHRIAGHTLAAAMDDAELLASITAGDMLAFRALPLLAVITTIPGRIRGCKPAIFLTLDWFTPGSFAPFLPTAMCPARHVQDSGALTIDLTSPARRSLSSSLRTRELLEGDNETIEILSSDDEMEVEASLSAAVCSSSDPPELAAPDPEPALSVHQTHIASNDNSDEFPSEPAPSGPHTRPPTLSPPASSPGPVRRF